MVPQSLSKVLLLCVCATFVVGMDKVLDTMASGQWKLETEGLLKEFWDLDKDGDGELHWGEMAEKKWQQLYAIIDTDLDGKITKKESDMYFELMENMPGVMHEMHKDKEKHPEYHEHIGHRNPGWHPATHGEQEETDTFKQPTKSAEMKKTDL
eukprot:gnl/MRDRNA2_/MRDRNA2_100609_c0_seq1.p1 gnl/MRDRNA2_/MRDRNA2_100609_c0~~gnl/MRDRNA2_/MRDRNA2_100609_c0_seq1.p1  ORF type:complete len:153 (-),score=39.40 gnl/MRDRNA2_/MRDRNA2_100609_c0_seq1:75-533(-)